jgi:endoglucanase
MHRSLIKLSLTVVVVLCPYMTVADAANEERGFVIRRGINISHWLSQSKRRGTERRQYIQEKDIQFIASVGYDHIRLPVDEEQLWDEAGQKETEAFTLLHKGISWARQHKLRVIVDLHILRSHHFNAKDKPLWTDPKEQETFLSLWRDLSAELIRYPVSKLAYELMNEAVADDPEDWNKLVAQGVAVVRKNEPKRTIVIGSNRWQTVNTFDQLRIPKGDRNIILSFHFYTPMLVTHYRASWTGVGKYQGPLNYPGRLVDPQEIEKLDQGIANTVKNNNGVYNHKRLETLFAKPLKLAKELDLPLYCGEWGAITHTPREIRLQWYRDMRANLEKHHIAWANWDYKGGFGIIQRDGQPDEELIDIMLDQK